MLYVSLIVELLRARPALMFWTAALGQAVLWVAIPWLFYAGPPGDVAEVLALGREFQLGTYLGPPLAFWLAEIVFRIAGMLGVYLLAQACVVVTYWCVYELGRAIVGPRHAAIAILLMVGIAAFTVPSPAFGPSVLGMALWALVLLHFWRALGEGRRSYWFVMAVEAGLLVLTTPLAWAFVAMLIVFTGMTARGRAALQAADPWFALVITAVVLFPYLIWIEHRGDVLIPSRDWLPAAGALRTTGMNALRLLAGLIAVHAGVIVLVGIATGWPRASREHAPVIARPGVDPLGRQFVFFFAVAPSVVALLLAAMGNRWAQLNSAAPLLVLSGLAIVVAAGDAVHLRRERVLSYAWSGLLVLPPLIAAIAILIVPWTLAVDLKVDQPAREMGRFFAERFQARTGRPLAIVAGDARLATLVVAAAPSRPSLYLDADPANSPWLRAEDIQDKGAIVLWPAGDTAGTPPSGLRDRFPGLVPELPRAFERPVQGVLPVLRVGWALIRPQPRAAAPAGPGR